MGKFGLELLSFLLIKDIDIFKSLSSLAGLLFLVLVIVWLRMIWLLVLEIRKGKQMVAAKEVILTSGRGGLDCQETHLCTIFHDLYLIIYEKAGLFQYSRDGLSFLKLTRSCQH